MTSYDADAFNALEAAGWDRKADAYDRIWAKITARVVDPLLDAAKVANGTRVLDVGTGPGGVAARAAVRGATVVGIDQAPGMLTLARAKHPSIDFQQASAEELPFGDGRFDAVLASFVLLHVARQDQALAEVARVLTGGGRVALTLWSPESAVHAVFLQSMAKVGVQLPANVPAGPPILRPDDEVVAMVERAGFTDVRLEAVRFHERFASPEAFRRDLLQGTVRMAPIIEGQPEDVRQRLDLEIDARLATYANDGQLELPVVVQLVAGVKR